jgi:hypothetical protein
MLHGEDPGSLEYLSQTSKFYTGAGGTESALFDDIFANTVNEWQKDPKRDEPKLTKALSKAIEAEHNQTLFHADDESVVHKRQESAGSVIKQYGRIDILLTPQRNASESASTPLAIIEVGRYDNDWWKKLDQNMKYLANMGSHQPDARLRFEKPLLLGALTIEGEGDDNKNLKVRLGVFFCSLKRPDVVDDYRMSLLWHSYTEDDLTKASKDFGRLLRATSDFSCWREKQEKSVSWKYLGPNCCKVVVDQVCGSGCRHILCTFTTQRSSRRFPLFATLQNEKQTTKVVLRSYDTRFRATQRRSDIYVNDPLETSEYKHLFPPTEQPKAADHPSSEHWLWRFEGKLLVIVAPYREGRHFAKKPGEFVPIISELEKLHKAGYVHGDIRGFNTVFTDVKDQGWLIDFDFGGKEEESPVYPKGYKPSLRDGERLGSGEKPIAKWHDWWSLGRLIFGKHILDYPAGADTMPELFMRSSRAQLSWMKLENQPPPNMIEELKRLFRDLDKNGWTVKPSPNFQEAICENNMEPAATDPAATGSPPVKVAR